MYNFDIILLGLQYQNIHLQIMWVGDRLIFSFAELVLNKSISVTEHRSFQLDVLVNDTEFHGPERSVMLHFNVSILPVSIQFPNVTYQFTVNRNAERFAQVRIVLITLLLFVRDRA